MDKLRGIDLSRYTTGPSALAVAHEVCRDLNWDPNESVSLSLVELLAQKLSPSPLTLQTMAVSEIDAAVLHCARGTCVAPIVQHAISTVAYPVMDLISTQILSARLESLLEAFPGDHFNHAVAVKANPVRSVLRVAQGKGCGAECASFAEVQHALSLGFAPRSIVFDSPCKTHDELYETIRAGVYVNLDNLEEVDKVRAIFEQLYPNGAEVPAVHDGQIGLRINPVVGSGSIASTSTANSASKFGLPLTSSTQDSLIALYKGNTWLQGVHVHVGSQGCPVELLVTGAARAVDFANAVGNGQVRVLDIGGGMPTVYDGLPTSDLSYADYAARLRVAVPDVFSGKYQVITEFGRSVFAKAGITVTRVESVKQWAGQNIAVVHIGANQFLRTAYLPHAWPHVFSVFSADGVLRDGPMVKQDIAGPLCFSGDFLAKDVLLPQMSVGDYVVVHDTGAYTVAMYSKYNSRPSTAIYGYATDANGAPQLTLFKDQESIEEVLRFWGP
ncbi:diaminopimelate decarboxylase [Achlya hypogyna]|uniref:Diaminopimelate decarboxylase n=1 Tax=Achlya hypogyna TaxID=1202772 RepID=A0A1V9YHH7_ACHHY|nr:diaminopimelate decarboxylase [Achlya hypogyna]